MTSISTLFSGLIGQLPVLLVLLAGGILAVMSWPRHPRASLLALIGVCVLGAATVCALFWYSLVLPRLAMHGPGSGRPMFLYLVSNIVHSLADGAGLGCLLAAVFLKR